MQIQIAQFCHVARAQDQAGVSGRNALRVGLPAKVRNAQRAEQVVLGVLFHR